MTDPTPPVDLEVLRKVAFKFSYTPYIKLVIAAADELESLRAQLAARDEEIKGWQEIAADRQAREAAALHALARKDALLREAEKTVLRTLTSRDHSRDELRKGLWALLAKLKAEREDDGVPEGALR